MNGETIAIVLVAAAILFFFLIPFLDTKSSRARRARSSPGSGDLSLLFHRDDCGGFLELRSCYGKDRHRKRFLKGLSRLRWGLALGALLLPMLIAAAPAPPAPKIEVFPSTPYYAFIIYENLAVFWVAILGSSSSSG